MTKRILIVGNGGREHALAWKMAQSAHVSQVYIAPGNAGTATSDNCQNIAIAATDTDALLHFAQDNAIDLTIIGPEAPLVAGIVDKFTTAGLSCFGPTATASQLEGSKEFAKNFLERHNIPTAKAEVFTDSAAAIEKLEKRAKYPMVIKADGLAAGKGVIIAGDFAEAKRAVHDILDEQSFGDAGNRLLIEDFIQGIEASFIVMVDGEDVLPLATSQDHKARFEGDTGPNTGGMGAYSPAPMIDDALHEEIMSRVIRPTVAGLKNEGIYYRGFLYAGLMIGENNTPYVLEFNCRFGDPETQPILMRLQSDLYQLIDAAINHQLGQQEAIWDQRPALGVVMVSEGYPGNYDKGQVITGLDQPLSNTQAIFHAGTKIQNNTTVTDGGRVLCATALGYDYGSAQANAYRMLENIHWPGASFRNDIGNKAIENE